MHANKLHINKDKCCFMHFVPINRSRSTTDNNTIPSDDLNLYIENDKVKKVSETKFLGIVLDDKLSWDGQIKDLKRKLNYALASINRIKNNIP